MVNKRYLDPNITYQQEFIEIIVNYSTDKNQIGLDQDIDTFTIPEERNRYTKGVENLKLIDEILKQTKIISKVEKVPIQVAEIITSFIELMDLTKLTEVAYTEYIVSLLDELYSAN